MARFDEEINSYVIKVLDGYWEQVFAYEQQLTAESGMEMPLCQYGDCSEMAQVKVLPSPDLLLAWPPWWFSCWEHQPTAEYPWPLQAKSIAMRWETWGT